MLLAPLSKKSGTIAWIHIWVFYFVPLVFIVPVPCCFYCDGSVVLFEVGNCDNSSLLFLLNIVLVIGCILCFKMNFRVDFSTSVMIITVTLMMELH
jgi:hypothetical protein